MSLAERAGCHPRIVPRLGSQHQPGRKTTSGSTSERFPPSRTRVDPVTQHPLRSEGPTQTSTHGGCHASQAVPAIRSHRSRPLHTSPRVHRGDRQSDMRSIVRGVQGDQPRGSHPRRRDRLIRAALQAHQSSSQKRVGCIPAKMAGTCRGHGAVRQPVPIRWRQRPRQSSRQGRPCSEGARSGAGRATRRRLTRRCAQRTDRPSPAARCPGPPLPLNAPPCGSSSGIYARHRLSIRSPCDRLPVTTCSRVLLHCGPTFLCSPRPRALARAP